MEFVAQFKHPSAFQQKDNGFLVFLASSIKVMEQAQPEIFSGEIACPLPFRNALVTLHDIVESRFYRPDLWRHMDPVVTAGNTVLRMECFSSCGSIYGRVDLQPEMFAEAHFNRAGTTNVDFNTPFIQNVSLMRPGKRAHFEMGEESVSLETVAGKTIEHKVKLPERWIKGFLQVQALQRQALPCFELDKATARQLLHLIPASAKQDLYLVPLKSRPQVLYRQPVSEPFICISGAQRLRLLQRLLPDIHSLRIYQAEETGVSLWVVDLGVARMTLALSSQIQHGFSGDGEALRSLSHLQHETAWALSAIQEMNHFTLDDLANRLDMSLSRGIELVDRLSIDGLLGYDRDHDLYFYRVLPFVNPDKYTPARVKGAFQTSNIEIEHYEKTADQIQAEGWVQGKTALYHVTLHVASGYLLKGHCTCAWIQKHALVRGPCKHLLALRFAIENNQ